MRRCGKSVLGWLTLGMLAAGPAAAEFRFGTPGEHFLRIKGRIQFRYTGVDESGANENSFRIRRLRLNFKGDAFPHVSYEFELSADPAVAAVPDRIRILDADVVFNYYPWTQIKVGQFKAPFGAEQITSSGRLQAIDRALMSVLTPDRQLGAMLTSASDDTDLARGLSGHWLDYGVGYFNGNGINQKGNDNAGGLLAARLVSAHLKHLNLGAHVLTSKDPIATAADLVGLALPGRRNGFGFDLHANHGPFSIWAEFADLRFNPEGDEAPREMRGYYIHPSFFPIKDRLDLWYRLDAFDPNRDVDDNLDKQWHHLGATYFVHGHGLKVQGEYILRREKGRELDDDILIVQLQLIW